MGVVALTFASIYFYLVSFYQNSRLGKASSPSIGSFSLLLLLFLLRSWPLNVLVTQETIIAKMIAFLPRLVRHPECPGEERRVLGVQERPAGHAVPILGVDCVSRFEWGRRTAEGEVDVD
jgi:hypothetical protein